MKIVNLGSLNFDDVYSVDHAVRDGETILSHGYAHFLGGKGLNQSLALARAGVPVAHAGAVGQDGAALKECLEESGVDTRLLQVLDTVSGRAIIQNAHEKNCIIVHGGANQCLTQEYITAVLSQFSKGDILLIQNEVSNVPFAMKCAKQQGMTIAFNASPITAEMEAYPLDLVDYFLINEVEGKALAKTDSDDEQQILQALAKKYNHAAIVLTIGEKGVLYHDPHQEGSQPAFCVPVADTTAAGDTFCGYFLAGLAQGKAVSQCLRAASMASAIAVSRHGAAPSIPWASEVEKFGQKVG